MIFVFLASLMPEYSSVSAQVVNGADIAAVVDSIAGVKPEDKRETTDTSRFKKERVDLDHVVNFTAKDSIVMYGKDNARMFGDGNITYGDIQLTASRLNMDMAKSEVYAIGAIDTSGEVAGNPVFKDKSGSYEAKTMTYNFKSEKGLITDIVTEQGEGYLTGGITKKVSDEDFYIKDAKYTTCDVLVPTFGEDYNRGFYLRNGGYYLALSDYADLALTGELYTRGGWGLTAQSNYAKRYKFHGNFNVSYLVTVNGEKGDNDYSKMKNFRVQWTHAQDAKANPNMSFSASVNFATSGYSRNNLDDYYSNSFTENTKSSTVNMTYKRPGSRWSFSTTASVSQRTADSTLSVSFPNLTVTMSQFAPFKRKKAAGDERWYEKIKISYSGRFQNSLTAKQDEFFKKSLVKDWRNGMSHTLPINATFNLFKYLNVTPAITLNDRMYTNKIRQQWDPNANAVVRDTTYNFYNVFDFNFSLSFSTKLYGFFKPLKFFGDKVNMIRHVITPSVSFSASPDFGSSFWGYYGQYERVNSDGTKEPVKYSYFSNGLFGNAANGKSGVVSFNISNNLEAKVKSDQDSTGYKKVSLIENLTLSQSYNFAADSLRWSNLNTTLLLRLTKGFNLNLSATWDVYKYGLNKYGTPVRINKLRLLHGGGWGRLASTGTSFNYTLNNDTFKNLFGRGKKKKNEQKSVFDNNQQNKNDSDQETNSGDGEFDSDGYMKWDFPWSLTFNYSLNYGYGEFDYKRLEYKGRWTQNLSLSGNVRPTKNWNLSMSASYNFDLHKIAYMNCSISREMHCFTMSASFVPVGPYKSYSFHIAVKSSILSDVKYDKHSSSSNGVTWY